LTEIADPAAEYHGIDLVDVHERGPHFRPGWCDFDQAGILANVELNGIADTTGAGLGTDDYVRFGFKRGPGLGGAMLGGGVRADWQHRERTGHDNGNGNKFAEHVILPFTKLYKFCNQINNNK
jgi:hypothetical protein